MSNWTKLDLQTQFRRATDSGWIAHFRQAATAYAFPIDVLLGIASRETNMRNIVGDGGHGYGIMQIDDRSFPDWCHSGAWKDVGAAIQRGALVLDSKREQVRSGQGKNLSVGGATFKGAANLSDVDLLRIAVAAYNCGLWAYYSYSQEGDPDQRSTDMDYSADTFLRASVFRELLAAEDRAFVMAIHQETPSAVAENAVPASMGKADGLSADPLMSMADAVLSDGSWVAFDSAPFPGDSTPGNKVLISIPSDFKPGEPFVITLFLHGHNLNPPCSQLDQIHKIPFQVREAAANTVLLAPRFGPQSEPGKFAQAGALAAFIAEASSKVADVLSGSGKTQHEVEQARQYLAVTAPIVVASFSGGCHALGYLLDNDTEVASRLCGLLLLDSLYDQRPENSLIAWLNRAFRRSWLVSLYLTTGDRNKHVIASLNAARIPFSQSNDWSMKVRALAPGTIAFSPATCSHCDIPSVGPPLLPVKAALDRLDVRYLKTPPFPTA